MIAASAVAQTTLPTNVSTDPAKRLADDWVALDGALNAAEVAKARVAEDLNAILATLPKKKEQKP